jgi:hypothetical protein
MPAQDSERAVIGKCGPNTARGVRMYLRKVGPSAACLIRSAPSDEGRSCFAADRSVFLMFWLMQHGK